jgi:hypothetical protein
VEDQERNQLAREIARGAIARVAPQELPIFRVQSDAYFRSPEAALNRAAASRAKDKALGFGVTEAMTLLTPVALAVAAGVVSFLLEIAHESVKSEASDALGKAVRGLLKRNAADATAKPADQTSALTAEQLALVRQTALDKALQLELPESQASLLADAVAGSLAFRPA